MPRRAGTVVNGAANDIAGNNGTDSVTVKLDKTAPTITGAIATTTPNGQRLVHRAGDGALHLLRRAVRHRRLPRRLDPDRRTAPNQSVTGTATDNAGNSATRHGRRASTSTHEHPTITSSTSPTAASTRSAPCPAPRARRPTASPASPERARSRSPAATPTASARSPTPRPPPTRPATRRTATGTYRVMYRFDGFLQPINDTAHQVGPSTSIFKAGQHRAGEVPAEEGRRDGRPGQHALPIWLTPGQGQRDDGAGRRVRVHARPRQRRHLPLRRHGQQYIYNWKTRAPGGNYWRIGVKLDDGQTYYVNIGLR